MSEKEDDNDNNIHKAVPKGFNTVINMTLRQIFI
jgi:hypothetical protein